MSEGRDATKLSLPIVKVVGTVIFIGSIIWFASAKNTTIESQSDDIRDLQTEMRNVPTRQEYNELKGSIDKISEAVKTIQDYLIKK